MGLVIFLAGCGAVMLAAGMLVRFSAVAIWDDAWFYTRYADNLIQSGSYQWNVQEKGYGLTAPLFGLLVALVRLTDLSPALTLWGISLLMGLLSIGLMMRWARQVSNPFFGFQSAFVLVALTWNFPTLASHFASGMETTTAVFFFGLYLTLLHKFMPQLSPGRTLLLGVLGGLAWGIRPELALMTWGMPIGLLLFSNKAEVRQGAGYILLFTVAITVLQLYLGLQIFGTVLPLSFWAKTTNPYGTEMGAVFKLEGLKQLVLFWAVNLPSLLALGIAFAKGKFRFWRFLALNERILLVGMILFWVYHSLLVLPIMSYSARFFYPLWPGLIWLGVRAWHFLSLEAGGQFSIPLPRKWQVGGAVIFFTAVTMVGAAATVKTRHSGSWALMGKFSVEDAYQGIGKGNWPGLDELSTFPPDFEIAATELGVLGMMRQGANVWDLSGLHDASMLDPYKGIERLLKTLKPDLIYMPSPAYSKLNDALMTNPQFERDYLLYKPPTSYYPVAILREGPYFDELLRIVSAP